MTKVERLIALMYMLKRSHKGQSLAFDQGQLKPTHEASHTPDGVWLQGQNAFAGYLLNLAPFYTLQTEPLVFLRLHHLGLDKIIYHSAAGEKYNIKLECTSPR